jgi:hypothetical protein
MIAVAALADANLREFEAQESAVVAFSLHQCMNNHWSLRSVRPNPSLKRSANGRPPGPAWRYAVHSRQPGPGVLPLAPA